jgi:hypothetical protein
MGIGWNVSRLSTGRRSEIGLLSFFYGFDPHRQFLHDRNSPSGIKRIHAKCEQHPKLGTFGHQLLRDYLSTLVPWWQYLLGGVYVLTILYLPTELMGIPKRIR